MENYSVKLRDIAIGKQYLCYDPDRKAAFGLFYVTIIDYLKRWVRDDQPIFIAEAVNVHTYSNATKSFIFGLDNTMHLFEIGSEFERRYVADQYIRQKHEKLCDLARNAKYNDNKAELWAQAIQLLNQLQWFPTNQYHIATL